MSGFMDRVTGRFKKAAGDLTDDERLRRQGATEERKAQAKDDLARAQREADLKANEVARLERETNRSSEQDREANRTPEEGRQADSTQRP